MSYMFSQCLELRTIYAGSGWSTASVTISEDIAVFGSCGNLVGGNGTTFDDEFMYVDYARIDTPSTLGYLTLKS